VHRPAQRQRDRSQPVTSGTRLRCATSAPALTSAGVHEPSIASTLSRVIRRVVLFATVFGSVLSSSRTSWTFFFSPSTVMPPAALTSSTACW